MRVNGFEYGYLATHRICARVQMLVPTWVWTRVRGFFQTADMGTNIIVLFLNPTNYHMFKANVSIYVNQSDR